MSQAVQPTRPDAAADASDNDVLVTPEVERIIRERLRTFDEDAKAARPWEDVLVPSSTSEICWGRVERLHGRFSIR